MSHIRFNKKKTPNKTSIKEHSTQNKVIRNAL